jgi:hypothetical protein
MTITIMIRRKGMPPGTLFAGSLPDIPADPPVADTPPPLPYFNPTEGRGFFFQLAIPEQS